MQVQIYEVCPDALNKALAEYLRSSELLVPPKNVDIIKTGHGKEMPPMDEDWFYKRAASVVRKLCINTIKGCTSGVSVPRLSVSYGNIKNRGCRPSKNVRGSKGYLRKILQDLEKCDWVVKAEKGRKLTNEAMGIIAQLVERVR
jgi:small subunit ribosomal protein S19e